MSSFLKALLARYDRFDEVIVTADEVDEWGVGELDWCLASKIFVPTLPATELVCRECPEQSVERVVHLEPNREGQPQAYLPCPQCGPVKIPRDRLRRWRLDAHRFWETLFLRTNVEIDVREIVFRRLWRIGRWRSVGSAWNVFLGRMLWQADGSQVIRQAHALRQSILFVPFSPLQVNCDPPPNVTVLADVLTWNGTDLVFDVSHIEGLLATTMAHRSAHHPRPARKRAERAATIERLVRLMKDHVASARDHAFVTTQAGEARLLPRPSQRDLARLAGVAEMAVSRCLRDSAARELRLLWELAADLDRLLELPPVRR